MIIINNIILWVWYSLSIGYTSKWVDSVLVELETLYMCLYIRALKHVLCYYILLLNYITKSINFEINWVLIYFRLWPRTISLVNRQPRLCIMHFAGCAHNVGIISWETSQRVFHMLHKGTFAFIYHLVSLKISRHI